MLTNLGKSFKLRFKLKIDNKRSRNRFALLRSAKVLYVIPLKRKANPRDYCQGKKKKTKKINSLSSLDEGKAKKKKKSTINAIRTYRTRKEANSIKVIVKIKTLVIGGQIQGLTSWNNIFDIRSRRWHNETWF